MRNLMILFPARNEADGLSVVVDMIPTAELRRLGWNHRMVLVDGYSTDGTAEEARRLPGAEVLPK